MTIAAHIDLLKDNTSRFWQCITRLAQQNPSDHFILFTQDNTLPKDFFSGNCTIVPVSPVIKNSLLLHYWYNLKLPWLLKKYNADIFISANSTVSLRTNVAQVMLVADDFIWQKNYPLKNEFSSYLKRYFPRFINKAAAILVTRAFLGQRFFTRYPGMEAKTQILPMALEQVYETLPEEKKIAIRKNFTEGHEYYYFECSPLTQPNMMALVKAFSIFKKRLKTGMQLVVLNKLNDNPIKDFHIYKYRNEVKLIPYTSEKDAAALLATAYAAVYLPAYITAQPSGLNALQVGVPLITFSLENSSSLYKDAAMYTGTDEKMIAENMMLLYKDEGMKNKLIHQGAAVIAPYNLEDNSDLLWQTILNCSGA
jgi:hypothetical protein